MATKKNPALPPLKNSRHFMGIVQEISRRRLLQRQMLRDGTIHLDLSSPVADDHRKLRRLTQDNGQVADALEALEHLDNLNSRAQLYAAVLQITCDGFAWLEALEEKS